MCSLYKNDFDQFHIHIFLTVTDFTVCLVHVPITPEVEVRQVEKYIYSLNCLEPVEMIDTSLMSIQYEARSSIA